MSLAENITISEVWDRTLQGEDLPPPPAPPSEPVDLSDFPVQALGHRAGVSYWFDCAGQFRDLTARQLSDQASLIMLVGSERPLIEKFQAHNKDGEPIDWFTARKAMAALIALSHKAGIFNPDRPQRHIGVWREGDRIVVHVGSHVIDVATDTMRPAGFISGDVLWPAHFAIPAPAPLRCRRWRERSSICSGNGNGRAARPTRMRKARLRRRC